MGDSTPAHLQMLCWVLCGKSLLQTVLPGTQNENCKNALFTLSG